MFRLPLTLLAAIAALCLPSVALAQDAAPVDPGSLSALLAAHSWAALAAVAIPLVLHLAQADVHPLGLTLPAAWRPVVVVALGQAAGVADALAHGAPWSWSLIGGAAASVAALLMQPRPAVTAIAGELLSTTGDGAAQPNASGVVPSGDRTAPTVPPVVSGLLLALGGLVLAGALTGCAGPLDTAVRAANGARAIGEASRTAITAACVPAYKAANTAAALAAVDARCLPAERAYVALAVAHAAAVVELQRAQLGQVTPADALAAAMAVGRAGADLAAAVKAVGQ